MNKMTKVDVCKVEFLCEDCNQPVEYTGESQMSFPPKHIHKCNKCRKKYALSKPSPAIEYR